MRRRGKWVWALAAILAACSGGQAGTQPGGTTSVASGGAGNDGGVTGGSDAGTPSGGGPAHGGVALVPPTTIDGWTFYGAQQGLPATTYDVAADEGGNVYVAGGDAVYAKAATADHFARFDAAAAGLTQNCYQGLDPFDKSNGAALYVAKPPGPAKLCPIISVGGLDAGRAIIGYEGYGTDGDYQSDWATDAGGLDLITFDGATLARTRHVFVGTPPGVICGSQEGIGSTVCNPWDYFWLQGRRKLRNVYRIAVNHHVGTTQHLDVWMAGTHATFTALFNSAAEARGWWGNTQIANCPNVPNVDLTVCRKFEDATNVWEHEHPAFRTATYPDGVVIGPDFTGDTWAVAIAPSGQPWAHNTLRLAAMHGDTSNIGDGVNMDWGKVFDLWPDTPTVDDDDVQSMAFCPDGTLWVGSRNHGLAQVNTATGAISGYQLPGGGQNVWALACDHEGSLWISTDWAEIVRYDTSSGTFTTVPPGLPDLAHRIAWNIQVDDLSTPRIVYFAMRELHGAPGGIVAYSGR